MTMDRRTLLRHLGSGAAIMGAGMISSKAFAADCSDASHCRTQSIPPRNRRGPILRVQPPYRHTERKWEKRTRHSKGKTRLKARSLRAQRTFDTPGNRRDLALTMWGEARGYGTLGMRAVGHVVMNRLQMQKRRFGLTVGEVCHKRKQFSCWNRNDPNKARMEKLPEMNENNPDWIAFMKADKLASEILAGIDPDNTGGATFYVASYMVPYWRDDMLIVGEMFGHIFFKEKPRRLRKKHRKAKRTKTHTISTKKDDHHVRSNRKVH
jgi:spore germination cell wall hydrolase CwlJ-like protein